MEQLRLHHPALVAAGARADDIDHVLYAMSNIRDKLNTIRNNAGVAYPSETLLSDAEAGLAINAVKTVFAYVAEGAGDRMK